MSDAPQRRWRWPRLVIAAVAVALLTTLGVVARWAIVAEPVGVPERPTSLPPVTARLVELGRAIDEARQSALTATTRQVPATIWVDLGTQFETDRALETGSLAWPAGQAPPKAERATSVAALRAQSEALAVTIEGLGIPEAVASALEAAGAAASAPLPRDAVALEPLAAGLAPLRRIAEAAPLARRAMRAGDLDRTAAWLAVIQAASSTANRLPHVLGPLVGEGIAIGHDFAIRTLLGEARAVGAERGVEWTRAALDRLERAVDDAPEPTSGARWAELVRWSLEDDLRTVTDAAGRVLPAWFAGPSPPGAAPAPPSWLDRLLRNPPGLLLPRRGEWLARAAPAVEALRRSEPTVPFLQPPPVPDAAFDPQGRPPDEPRSAREVLAATVAGTWRLVSAERRNGQRHRLMQTGLRLAIEIERHRLDRGRSPARLADLGLPAAATTDPWTGEPFGYAPGDPAAGDRWRLWSAGPDRTDDGGGARDDIVLHPEAFDEP